MNSARGGKLPADLWRIDLRPIDSLSGSRKRLTNHFARSIQHSSSTPLCWRASAESILDTGKPSSMVHGFPSMNRK